MLYFQGSWDGSASINRRTDCSRLVSKYAPVLKDQAQRDHRRISAGYGCTAEVFQSKYEERTARRNTLFYVFRFQTLNIPATGIRGG